MRVHTGHSADVAPYGARRRLSTALALALFGTVLVPFPVNASLTPNQVLEAGVRSLTATLDGLAATPELATPLPMTRRSPADILGFPGALSSAFDAAATELSTHALTAATFTAGDVEVVVGAANGDGTIPVTMTATVSVTEDVPVLYADIPAPEDVDGDGVEDAPQPGIVLYGSGVGSTIEDVTAALTVTLPLTFDPNAPADPADPAQLDLDRAVSLSATATVGLTVDADDDALSFTSRYGFTDVTVTGDALLDLTAAGTFTDPDGVGGITPGEWTLTLLDDLVALGMTNSNGADPDVDIALTLDSDLITPTSDGTLVYRSTDETGAVSASYVDDPTDDAALAVPTLTAGAELARFANVTSDDALAALAQLSSAVGALQGQVDAKLPLLTARLSDAYSPAAEIVDVVEEQGSAAIVCGRANTVPPSGAELPGDTWYCQAYTSQDVTGATWSLPDDSTATLAGATSTATVGTAPTANITVTGSPEEPPVSLSFTVANTEGGGSTTFTAARRFRTAQELEAVLREAADDDPNASIVADLTYDAATASLVYDLALTADPAAITSAVDLGDTLYSKAHLRNVSSARAVTGTTEGGLSVGTAARPVTVDVGSVKLDTGFGLLLQDDIAGVDPDDGENLPLDRYVMAVRSGAELTVDGVAITGSGFALDGSIGYLSAGLTAGTFAIAEADEAGPVLAADLSMPPAVTGPPAIPAYLGVPTLVDATPGTLLNTMLLRHVLTGTTLSDNLTATYDLAVDAGLTVTPAGGTLGLGSALDLSVGVTWATWPFGAPTVAPSLDYATWLKPFDIVPSATGTHTGAAAAAQLTDSSVDMLTAFGYRATAGDVIGATLHNLTSGGSCTPVVIVDGDTLGCGDGGSLVGGSSGQATDSTEATADNGWDLGDAWEVRGDPTALRDVVYESLFDLANGLALTDDAAHRRPLPLVGLRPGDLTPQFAVIRDTVADLLTRVPALDVAPAVAPPVGEEPATPAAPDLQGLVTELDDALTAIGTVGGVAYGTPSVDLSVTAMTNPGETGAGSVPHLVLSVDVPVTGTVEAPIRIDLDGASDLDLLRDPLTSSTTATLPVSYSSTATLDLAVPLSLDVPVDNTLALNTSGVSQLEASASGEALSLTGSLGALGLVLGTDAVLEGTHGLPSGTHDGAPAASGTHTPSVSGTAGTGTTATSVAVAGFDFRGLDGTEATRTSDGSTCTVSAAAEGSFTCIFPTPPGDPAPATPTWADGDAFTIAVSDGTLLVDASQDLAAVVDAGMTVVNDTQDASCTLAAADINAHVLDCALSDSKSWTSGDTYRVIAGDTLVDSTRDGSARPTFTQLFDDGDGTTIPLSGVTITAGTETCTPTAVTDTTIDCDLSGDAVWAVGTAYSISFGPATATLVDETTRFDGLDLEELVLTNTTDGATCTVASTTRHTATCAAALSGGGSWDAGDAYEAGGIGVAAFDLDSYTLDAVDTDVIADYVAAVVGSPAGPTTEPTCAVSGTSISRSNDACALLSVELKDDAGAGRYLGLLTYEADIAGATDAGALPTLPSSLEEAAAGEEPIEWSLLSTAFGQVKRLLRDALEGTMADEPFPLIGLDVSAGTKLEEALDELELLIAERAETDAPAIVATTTMTEARTAISTFFTQAFADVKVDGVSVAELLGDVTVTLLCAPDGGGDPVDCTDANVGADIDDVRVTFSLGYNLGTGQTAPGKGCANCDAVLPPEDTSLKFDIGLDGLPIEGSAGLASKAGWSLDVDLGIDRENGPYVGSSVDSGQFELGANVGLAAPAGGCPTLPSLATGFSSERCATLLIGFFQATVFDGDGTPGDGTDEGSDTTQLDMKVSLDLRDATGGDGKISAADLLSGTSPSVRFDADATGNVDLYFVTTVDPSGSLPSVQGQVHVGFVASGGLASVEGVASGTATSSYEDIVFDNLVIDLGSFIEDFVAPIAAEVKKYTEPFKPIIDLLRTPIPVISDIAKLTGNAAITILTLIQEAGYDTKLVDNILDVISFANDMAGTVSSGVMGLGPSLGGGVTEKGGFVTKPRDTAKGPCGQTNQDGSKQAKDCTRSTKRGGTTTKTKVTQLQKCGSAGTAPCTGKELTRSISRTVNKPKLTGTALTFPFLNDANQIFGMLMGETDAVLVRFDAGTLAASAGMSVSWGPFMAGPVPIDISIGGTFGFSARFAMGYDTRGLTNMLRQQPEDFDPAALLDGIYIDDLDANGNDVPEITLAVTVTLGASVSVKIFKVGLEGGVTITVEFNLNDPDRDGRLRIEEISRFGDNPLCLFEVRGLLEFFLQFFVEIDLKFWTKRWSATLFRLRPPIELFEVRCDPPPPDLATPVEIDGTQVLRINAGPNVGHRNFREDVPKEKFVLRQIAVDRVSIEAFGLYEEESVSGGRIIWADLGTENDTIQLLAGADTAGTEFAFTTGSSIRGGSGADRITTGDGVDEILGDGGTGGGTDGNDTISAGGGDDTIDGGGGADVISGGFGDDIATGGAGTDSVSGDAGRDVLRGGSEDDELVGGPGLDPRRYARLPAARKDPKLLDGADVLIGEGGTDRLKGHAGDDVLMGDGLTFSGAPTDAQLRTSLKAVPIDPEASGYGAYPTALHAPFTAQCGADLDGSAADQLDGESGRDTLLGGGGNDDLNGGQDDDVLCGNAGHDLLEGDSATVTTAPGDDRLEGGSGHDRLFGRAGDDTADGGPGDDLVDGGDGDDVVGGGLGSDAVLGGLGHDIGFGDQGDANGATIDDSGSDAADDVILGPDATGPTSGSTIACATTVAVIGGKLDLDGNGTAGQVGDAGRFAGLTVMAGKLDVDRDGDVDGDDNGVVADTVVGAGAFDVPDGNLAGAGMLVGGNADCMFGDGGHDAMFGGADDDRIFGDVGNDHLAGGLGDDWVRGAQGHDELHGDAGDDELLGDSGDDRIYGGADEDLIHGGVGTDAIEGNGGADEIHGETGPDRIIGGSSSSGAEDDEVAFGGTIGTVGDRIWGGPGADVIAGDNATITDAGVVTLHDVGSTDATRAGPDVIDGGTDDDVIHGQGEDDVVTAGDGDDYVEGNGGSDDIDGNAGLDRLVGGSAAAGVQDEETDDGDPTTRDGDHIDGGAGPDVIAGDNALIASDGAVTLLDIATSAKGGTPGATPTDAADGAISGGDHLVGGAGADRIFGQGGHDLIEAGDDADHAEGNAGGDELHGGAGADVLVGGTSDHTTLRPAGSSAGASTTVTYGVALDGDDVIHGDAGDDIMLGDDVELDGTSVAFDTTTGLTGVDGDDELHGGTGEDRLWGQRGDDDLYGDADHDVLIGDLARVEPAGGATEWPGGAPRYDVVLVTPDVGGTDELYGGTGDDRLYAGAATDLLEGGLGDDRLEGNGGDDLLYGHSAAWRTTPVQADLDALGLGTASDEDDLIGGSSSVHPGAADGALDGDDHLVGDEGQDVLIGDNGDVHRIVAEGGGDWDDDDVTGGHRRDVDLFDRARTADTTPALATVSGADTLFGGAHNDRLFGEGGDDHLRGEAGEDQLQGNQGGDWLEGNDHDDDLIGGSSTADAGVGEFDGADRLHGGAGQDVVAGDNASIIRDLTDDPYLVTFDRFTDLVNDRWVVLHDLDEAADATRSGADLIVGGSDTDIAFGQDGDDRIFGGSEGDYAEGNGGADLLVGDRLPEDTSITGSLVVGDAGGLPAVPASLQALADRLLAAHAIAASTDDERDGVQGPAGQDDLIGGSSLAGHRDTGDTVLGDGAQDMVLGDNGALVRPLDLDGDYLTYEVAGDPDRIVRRAERFDVGGSTDASGGDLLLGGTGDDAIWAQDGDDRVWGEDGDDDLFGELGDDEVYGGNGEDALVGDRGGVVNTLLTADNTTAPSPLASFDVSTSSPPFIEYSAFLVGEVDRRVDLAFEEPDAVGGPLVGEPRVALVSEGVTTGGDDLLRGGPDHDVLHGGAGDDLLNGDSGGDAVFGYDGADVLWGGRGNPDPLDPDARGVDDRWVDHLFGGRGGTTSPWPLVSDGADVIDYRPRTLADTGGLVADPDEWHAATAAYDDPEGEAVEDSHQHHHGIDWMYGGWDRDVMQGNLENPGPNEGDRLIDWSGVYNLYTACSPDYGGYNSVRVPSPTMEDFLHRLAYARGVGSSLAGVRDASSSAYNALAFVYKPDVKKNTGKPYPGTPGHLTETACTDPTP